MCSEQGAGVVLLLALCFPVGHTMAGNLADALQADPEPVCQRWYDYQGRGDDGRAKWDYRRGCNRGN